jgi:hypothetical protein
VQLKDQVAIYKAQQSTPPTFSRQNSSLNGGTPALPLAFKKGSQRLDELQDKVSLLRLHCLLSFGFV